METIKFSDFVNGNYGEYVDKRTFKDTLATILIAMLIVYLSPSVIHMVAEIIYKISLPVGGM